MTSFKNLRGRKGLPKLNKWEHEGRGILVLVIAEDVMVKIPMKSCLSPGKSKFSLKVLASVQDGPDSSG